MGAEFRVTNVKSPILSMGKLVNQGCKFEAGPTRCKMSKWDRSVTLGVVKNSLSGWTRKLTRRLKELAMLMQELLHQWWRSYMKNYRQAQARPHQASRELAHLVRHQLNTWTVSAPVEDLRKRLRELRAPMWGHENTNAGPCT